MDKQQVFDKVSKHLLKQNERCVRDSKRDFGCAYRGENNTSCAIGCLIPDNLYDPTIEGLGLSGVGYTNNPQMIKSSLLLKILEKSLDSQKFTDDELIFLRQLQSVHDNNLPHSWKHELSNFAFHNNLDTKYFETL